MMAELIAQYIPKIVNLLNYIPASAAAKKRENWEHLNCRVFKRINIQLTSELIKRVSEAKPGMIEHILLPLRSILHLGDLAVVPPNKRLQHVKSRFMNIRRHFDIRNRVGNNGNVDENVGPNGDRHFHEFVSGNNNQGTIQPAENPMLMYGPSETLSEEAIQPSSGGFIRSSIGGPNTQEMEEGSYGYGRRPSTAPPMTIDLSHKTEDDNYNNNHSIVNSRKRSVDSNRRQATLLPEDKYNAQASNNDEDVYDEIYCDSAKNLEKHCDGGGRKLCEEEEVSKRSKTRVRKYEYREEYILNGMKVGSTAYCLPHSVTTSQSMKNSDRENNRLRWSNPPLE